MIRLGAMCNTSMVIDADFTGLVLGRVMIHKDVVFRGEELKTWPVFEERLHLR